MECVRDRGVNSGLHAKLLIHPRSLVLRGRLRSEGPKVGMVCSQDRGRFPCKTPLISLTAGSGEADAKGAGTAVEAGAPDAGALPREGPRHTRLSGHRSPRSGAPAAAPPRPRSPAHLTRLSVGSQPQQQCVPSRIAEPSERSSPRFFLSPPSEVLTPGGTQDL